MKPMDCRDIIKIIAQAAKEKKTVDIFYPKTNNSREGWREVEPYNLSTGTEEEGGEHLIYGENVLSPGHIFNAYTINSKDDHLDSFIIGKIKRVKPTGKEFIARNGWDIKF